MNHFLNPDSAPMSFMASLGDLMLLNLLWLITSLPIFTIGASTTALYSVLIQFDARVIHDSSTLRRYLKAFRSNFRQSTLIFLILALPMAVLVLDFLGAAVGMIRFSTLWLILLILPGLIWCTVWSYSFPMLAIFENSIRQTLKNMLLIAISHPLATVVICGLNLLPAGLLLFLPGIFLRLLPLWLFVGFALIAKANAILLGRIFSCYVPASQPD